MIAIHNLAKTFDGTPAVNRLCFHAADSAITGLLGANGAGKTTTLRMICGVLTPDDGRVIVDHSASSDDPMEHQSRIGALLDHAGLYSRLTVRENLTYFGQLRGMPPTLLHERTENVLSALGLQSIAERRAARLSQGERMKLAIGRALIHSPGNLILDEPTNGLDVPSVRALRDLLRRLRDAGTCIIFSSHVLEEVRNLCDKVVIIASGRLVDEGTPAEICARARASTLEEAFVRLTCTLEELPC